MNLLNLKRLDPGEMMANVGEEPARPAELREAGLPPVAEPWRLFGAWLATASLAATTPALFAQAQPSAHRPRTPTESISKGRYLDGDDELTTATFDASSKVQGGPDRLPVMDSIPPFPDERASRRHLPDECGRPGQPEEWARSFSNATPRDALPKIAGRCRGAQASSS